MSSWIVILNALILLGLLVFAAFSLLPYYPEDMDFYAGGVTGVAYPYNRFGAAGAHLGWGLLMTFGLAAYFLLAIAILCSLRRLLWRRCLRRR